MKKIMAFVLSLALIVSFSGCEFLFRQDPSPTETDRLPEPTANIESVPPSIEPTKEPSIEPSAPPDVDEPTHSADPEPSMPPENAEELTIYINGSPLTADVIPYTAPLRQGGLEFTIRYDASAYNVEFKNNAYVFKPTAEDAYAQDYIEISYINGGKAESLLPSFIDSYIDFTDIEFASYSSIGIDQLSAESIIAYNSEQYINAYLADVTGGLITIVISSSAQNTENFAWFNAMVGTFSIK